MSPEERRALELADRVVRSMYDQAKEDGLDKIVGGPFAYDGAYWPIRTDSYRDVICGDLPPVFDALCRWRSASNKIDESTVRREMLMDRAVLQARPSFRGILQKFLVCNTPRYRADTVFIDVDGGRFELVISDVVTRMLLMGSRSAAVMGFLLEFGLKRGLSSIASIADRLDQDGSAMVAHGMPVSEAMLFYEGLIWGPPAEVVLQQARERPNR